MAYVTGQIVVGTVAGVVVWFTRTRAIQSATITSQSAAVNSAIGVQNSQLIRPSSAVSDDGTAIQDAPRTPPESVNVVACASTAVNVRPGAQGSSSGLLRRRYSIAAGLFATEHASRAPPAAHCRRPVTI